MQHVFTEGISVFIFVGFLVVFISVFGSYVGLGGHLGALYQPFEFVLIAGAALGAYIASSSGKSMKLLAESLPIVIRKSPYSKELYMELMALLYVLLNKARRDGLMSIESDIEEPQTSPIFTEYPRILRDENLMEFITDYMRLMVSGNMSSYEIETLMDQEIEDRKSTRLNSSHVRISYAVFC